MIRSSQRRILQAMGIDVWVRRREAAGRADAAPQAEQSAAPVTAAPAREPLQDRRPMPAAPSESPLEAFHAPRLRLDCLQAQGLALVGEIAGSAELRLARDIVAASASSRSGLAGSHSARTVQFEWPQTVRGDQSMAACRAAFGAFLRGLADRQGAAFVIVAGERAAELLAVRDGVAVELWRPVQIGNAVALPAPSVAELQRQPGLKRALWFAVLNNR
jgi:hypothetical protein